MKARKNNSTGKWYLSRHWEMCWRWRVKCKPFFPHCFGLLWVFYLYVLSCVFLHGALVQIISLECSLVQDFSVQDWTETADIAYIMVAVPYHRTVSFYWQQQQNMFDFGNISSCLRWWLERWTLKPPCGLWAPALCPQKDTYIKPPQVQLHSKSFSADLCKLFFWNHAWVACKVVMHHQRTCSTGR